MTGTNLIRVILVSSFILLSSSIYAEKTTKNTQVAGKVLLSVGNVYSQRSAKKVTLKRRSQVLEQDEIHVGNDARAQIRMIDSALISLQENSVLKITKYRYQENNEGNSALLELLSGGLRTITGKIGKSNKKAYELRTPLATIGIRGTDYEVQVVGDGLYVGVWEGGINLHSSLSENNNITLGKEQEFSFVFINTEGEIKGLDTAPSIFSDDHSTSTAPTTSTNSATSSSSSSSNASSLSATTSSATTSSATLAHSNIDLPDPDALQNQRSFKAMIVNQSNPSGIITANSNSTDNPSPTFETNGTRISSNSNTTQFNQSIDGYDVSWGHWLNSTSSINGVDTQSDDSLLWTTYDSSSPEIVSTKSGIVSYNNVVDSLASSTQGAVTNLDVNMDVNFDSGAVTNGVVSANTSSDTHSDTWIGLFDGQVQSGHLNLQMNDASVINSDPLATTVNVRDASGSINGDFIGDQAQGVIGAFELSEDNTTNHIEGVFVVEPQ